MADATPEYIAGYAAGFAAAKSRAEEYVQQARCGDADTDFRSIAVRIRRMQQDVALEDDC